jgi:hypothetical protein
MVRNNRQKLQIWLNEDNTSTAVEGQMLKMPLLNLFP